MKKTVRMSGIGSFMPCVIGHGEPVIFVHGNMSTHRTWAGVVNALKSEFSCVLYNLRGHGNVPESDDRFELADLVGDLDGVQARAGLARAHLVGHSLGGVVAAAYAREHNTRVASLTLLATPAGRSEEDLASLRATMTGFKDDGVAETVRRLARRWYTAEFAARDPDAIARRIDEILAIDERALLRAYELSARPDMLPWLRDIRCPTLVLTGENADGAGPPATRRAAAEIPDGMVVVLDGLGNGILTEAPDRVAGELRQFFRAHPADCAVQS